MNRRQVLAALVPLVSPVAFGAGDFGASKGFPHGWPPLNAMGGQPMPWTDDDYLIGNYSGGIETFWPTKLVKKYNKPSAFASVDGLPTALANKLKELQKSAGKPAALVIRKGGIAFENYEFQRTADMRFFGKSMAKSVLSLLIGACLKDGVISDLDHPIKFYARRRIGESDLGGITLQNAMNMSGGVNICIPNHCKATRDDVEKWGYPADAGRGRQRLRNTSVVRTLQDWRHGFKYEQGTKFEYNPVDPSLVGVALDGIINSSSFDPQMVGSLGENPVNRSISEFMSQKLWIPMGAEADGSWSTDSVGHELVDGSFSATLRDWGRLGLLVAQKGAIGSNQIIPEKYILDCRDTSGKFSYLAPGNIPDKPLRAGYKNFFHLPNESNTWLKFQGAHGQSIFSDLKTESVMVILSASNNKAFDGTYEQIFSEIVKIN
jgi:CubicO group peptidase (beta-lactamase class C family)